MICSVDRIGSLGRTGSDTALGSVTLLAVSAEYARDARAYLAKALGPAERAVFAGVAPARRLSWLAGRAAAKAAIRGMAGELPVHPQIVADDFGRPVPTPSVAVLSIAHGGRWAVAAARPDGRVGVDVERLRPLSTSAVRAMFTPDELALASAGPLGPTHAGIALWGIREAVIKAFGGRFTNGWATVRLHGLGPGTADVGITADRSLSLRVGLHQQVEDDHLVTIVSSNMKKECSPWNPALPSPRSPLSATAASFPPTPTMPPGTGGT